MLAAPIWELIHTGKNTAKVIENNFEYSPIPNQAITSAIIATGGNERKIWNKGLKDSSKILILPVSKPNIIPIMLPIDNPMNTLDKLDLMCKKNSPESHISIKDLSTFVGGGNKVMFTKPVLEINCHRAKNIKIGTTK